MIQDKKIRKTVTCAHSPAGGALARTDEKGFDDHQHIHDGYTATLTS